MKTFLRAARVDKLVEPLVLLLHLRFRNLSKDRGYNDIDNSGLITFILSQLLRSIARLARKVADPDRTQIAT